MKIAILGNGKMGQHISKLAKKRGHTIACVSSSEKPAHTLDLSTTNVAIDFSTPTSALTNISHAINSSIPVVSGTTGWLESLKEIESLCTAKKGAFLYASNFSLGMNIFFELNKNLAKLMQNQNYESSIHEIHHIQKLDSPSGTALSLGEQIDSISGGNTTITSDRIEDVPGTHTVAYSSSVDDIEIKHTAKSRNGFAIGAIIAAEWIVDKKGVYSLEDIF